ncbi:MAG: DinB family protein [candidate division Zixibacteria bacterium]|nr:DinB family protein [candidate division Zixibacteria bacterium]MDH3938223.1 DinB family protein [candidate division Zixibacteria bacterium]MDH4032913.1 DinB family protein [candidate division Zixibacteria bacterium]
MKHEIKLPRGYDPKTQTKVGLFAAQLDDQLKRLKNNVKGLTIKQLEWQQKPGMNTIGMLLAHLALVEVWWIRIAPKGIPWQPDGKKLIQKACGFEDDGLPMPPSGRHSKYLKGYSLERYLKILAKVRRSIHREMKVWRDRDLDKLYALGSRRISRMWTLYHVLEHFAAHFGQVLMLKHLMRDAGVLPPAKKKK